MLERMTGTRVVSTQVGLESLLADSRWPAGRRTIRFAFDELLTFGELDESFVKSCDPHAIIVEETSFFAVSLSPDEGSRLLENHCEWEPPSEDSFPTQAQGAVAGIPTKILFEQAQWLFVVQSPYVKEFEERVF